MKTQNLLSSFLFLLFIYSSCSEKCINPPVVNASKDTIVYNAESLTLNATTDADSGRWSILSGDGGSFDDATFPDTKFSGLLNHDYDLEWRSENECGISMATLKVSFQSKYTVDQMVDSISWIQQSCFRIKGSALTVYIDPQGIKAGTPMADVILITHNHGDHFSPTDIKRIANENTLIYGPANCKYSGVCKEFITMLPGDTKLISPNLQIKTIPSYNIVKASWHPKSANNVGFVITLDGLIIYHAGDTERIPEMKDIDCDIAMLPLGQTYTMVSVADAAESAKDVKANVALPMHYGSAEGTVADANTFKLLLEGQIEVFIKTRE